MRPLVRFLPPSIHSSAAAAAAAAADPRSGLDCVWVPPTVPHTLPGPAAVAYSAQSQGLGL